jgi:hypothetical protein
MWLKYIGSCIICLIITVCTQAQSWQWGVRGVVEWIIVWAKNSGRYGNRCTWQICIHSQR